MSSNDKDDKKKMQAVFIGALLLFYLFAFLEWRLIHDFSLSYFDMYDKTLLLFHKDHRLFKLAFSVFVFLAGSLYASKTDKGIAYKIALAIGCVLTGIPFFLGYSNLFFYDLVIYPAFLILFTFFLYQLARHMNSKTKEEDLKIDRVPKNGENLFSVTYPTDKMGDMVVNNVRTGMSFLGGMGAGKTKLIESTIYQLVKKGFCGLIYDYEGDATRMNAKGDKPLVLSRIAYQAVMEKQEVNEEGLVEYIYYESRWWGRKKMKIYDKPLKFEMINFADPLRSKKFNLFNPKYHKTVNSISAEAARFILAVDPSLQKGGDGFWAKSSKAMGQMVAEILYLHVPYMCTVPHWVTIITSNTKVLLEWITSYEGFENRGAILLSAYENAGTNNNQLTSQISSAQAPLSELYNDELFWSMCPLNEKEEINLDINNYDSPAVLSVGNSTKLQGILEGPISTIISHVISHMDELNKRRGLIAIDEFNTTNLNGQQVSSFMGVVRKKGIAVIIGYQILEQGIVKMGKDLLATVLKSFNNTFVFRNKNHEVSKQMVESLGTRKVKKKTTNSEGGTSTTLVDEPRLQVGQILNQPTGHATGEVIDGDPEIYHTQFSLFKQSSPDDLPYQCDPSYITGTDEELDRGIIRSLMKENKDRIKAEVDELFAPIREKIKAQEAKTNNKDQNETSE